MSLFWKSYWPATILIVGYIIACALDYGDPLHYKSIEVLTPRVVQGEDFQIRFVFTRTKSGCRMDRERIIVDGGSQWHYISMEEDKPTGPAGPERPLTVSIKTDASFAPGLSAYRPILKYSCPLQLGPVLLPNLLQILTPRTVDLPDLQFEIVARN